MARKHLTKRNVKSVANQIERAMLDAVGDMGCKTIRGTCIKSEIIMLTDPSSSWMSLNIIDRVMTHIKRFEDLYCGILMGVCITMDDDGGRIPAIEVELLY